MSESQAEEREEFENTYFDILTEVRDFIEQCKVDSAIRIQNNHSDKSSRNETPVYVSNPSSIDSLIVKLPTITVPKFDGSFKDWIQFRDTFKSLIHENSRLSNIQKFHYLNLALIGDSARVIQSLGVLESNYELAWQVLIDRYKDSLQLIHYHTKSLFDLNPITKPSYVSLRQLIDDTSNHLLVLK
ncbi:uncharacterized protein LOC117181281 [Belonocnema kinseyi]|uniref:uncharacterized protein LOC117181281 n=1 Tax=Belonocnema kinseyi TaxID=2817044 RepID=UPI00143DCDD5|nr:uncharacterized protein LOC117181281 [Belonocnema kinseyi]